MFQQVNGQNNNMNGLNFQNSNNRWFILG
jgi:hypothetical protein